MCPLKLHLGERVWGGCSYVSLGLENVSLWGGGCGVAQECAEGGFYSSSLKTLFQPQRNRL